MNIDFPPPSKGTYSNAGSSRQLASYLEQANILTHCVRDSIKAELMLFIPIPLA